MNDENFSYKKGLSKNINANDWNPIGFHKEFSLDISDNINDVTITMKINTPKENLLQFISFDFDIIDYDYFKSGEALEHFIKKTTMHIPHIYYLNTLLPFNEYLTNDETELHPGFAVVLKGCNRCARYIPINIENQVQTLSYSLHCKKKAPCTHPLFRSYTIDNYDDLTDEICAKDYVQEKKVVSHYGHQLECKACKKFFVNAPLNPKRNSQQFREDSLRRRATEVLVNHLLDKELVHHEYRKRNKKEFSEYIWNKFGQRCFKCGKKIALDEMHLDHTMPLAFLYRLDETATCLCSEHNSRKRDHFPVDYYSEDDLIKLSKFTGIDIDLLRSKSANPQVVHLLVENVVWVFDDFLQSKDYQKVRDGRLTADKIYASIVRVLDASVDLVNLYHKKTGKYPTSITIG